MSKPRLIDANEAKDIIKYAQELTEWQAKEACDCIDCCETAYDIGKVINQLKNESFSIGCAFAPKETRTKYIKTVDAIEIVKGGVNNE